MEMKKKVQALKIPTIILAILVLCSYCFVKLWKATEATNVYQRLMIAVMILAGMAILATTILAVRKHLPLYKIYPILGLTFGVIFTLIIPTDTTPDEIAHLDNTYILSNRLLGIDEIENPWNLILKRNCDVAYEEHELSLENYDKYYHTFGAVSEKDLELDLTKNDSTGNSTAYIIGALGVSLARVLHLNYGWMTLMGTLFQLLFFVAIVTYSLKIIPYGQRILFTIALLPMTLQQVSSFSYDNMMIACGILVTSLFLCWYQQETLPVSQENVRMDVRHRIGQLVLFAFAALMMIRTKGGAYALLLLLPIIIIFRYMRKNQLWKNRKVQLGIVIMVLLLLAASIYLWKSGVAYSIWERVCLEHYIPSSDAYGAAPITFITRPGYTLKRLAMTVLANGKDYLYSMVGGLLGWLQLVISGKIIWPLLLVLILSMVRTREEKIEVSKGVRGALIIMSLLSMLICVAAMMYLWTPATATVIAGVQGRYFIPPLLALLVGVGLWSKPCWPAEYVDDYFVMAVGFLDYLVIASVLLIFI